MATDPIDRSECMEHLIQVHALREKKARPDIIHEVREDGLDILANIQKQQPKYNSLLWDMFKDLSRRAGGTTCPKKIEPETFIALFPWYVDSLLSEEAESRVAMLVKAMSLDDILTSARMKPNIPKCVRRLSKRTTSTNVKIPMMCIPFYNFFLDLTPKKLESLKLYRTAKGREQKSIRAQIDFEKFTKDLLNDHYIVIKGNTPDKEKNARDIFRIWHVYNLVPEDQFRSILRIEVSRSYRTMFWATVLHKLKEMPDIPVPETKWNRVLRSLKYGLIKTMKLSEIVTKTPANTPRIPRFLKGVPPDLQDVLGDTTPYAQNMTMLKHTEILTKLSAEYKEIEAFPIDNELGTIVVTEEDGSKKVVAEILSLIGAFGSELPANAYLVQIADYAESETEAIKKYLEYLKVNGAKFKDKLTTEQKTQIIEKHATNFGILKAVVEKYKIDKLNA